MNKTKKKTLLYGLLISAGVHILLYFLYYVPNYVYANNVFFYITYFSSLFIESTLPLASATLLFACFSTRGRIPFGASAIIALPRILYFLPYSYLESFYAGNDTPSALLLALFSTVLYTLFFYGEIILTYFVISFIIGKLSSSKRKPDFNLRVALLEKNPFDFSSPTVIAFFAAASVRFVYNLITEIYDTVVFLVNFSATFSIGEIIYMVGSYLFILATLLLSHLIAFKIKRGVYLYTKEECRE